MSLDELLEVKVTTASKKPENLFDAPGSITSYSRQDFDLLGLYSLAELANITPGYSTYTRYGENTFETRGQMASGFDNNRHLVLFDGIPINHVRANAAMADLHFPALVADRVEFLRGPASALYGISAFYGVVNVVPFDASDQAAQSDARLTLGTLDQEVRAMSNLVHDTETGRAAMGFGYYKKNASEALAGDGSNPDHLDYDDQESIFLYGSWQYLEGPLKGLKIGSLYSRKEGGLGELWADYSSELNKISWETFVLYSKYDREIRDFLNLRGYIKYNYATEAATYYNESETRFSSYDYPFHSNEAQIELDWDLANDQSLIIGANYDSRHGEAAETIVNNSISYTPKTPTIYTLSAYFQYKLNLPVLEGMQLTTGARLDNGNAAGKSYSKLSPRIAVVQRLSEMWNLKLLYGAALRGPSVKEIGVNQEIRYQIPSAQIPPLAPEEIETFEIAPYFHNDIFTASITYFHTETENTIFRNRDNLTEYSNTVGTKSSDGFEFELSHRFPQGFTLFTNYSKARSTDKNGTQIADVPSAKTNLGLLWEGSKNGHFRGSLVAHEVSDFNAPDKTTPPYNGYTTVDLNLIYQIHNSAAIELQALNLFDKEYSLPLSGSQRTPMAGANIRISFSYNK